MKFNYFVFVVFFCLTFISFSQDSGSPLCNGAQPICSSSEFTFPNTSDNTPAEVGPNYGCLFSQPNPAWFYLQIGQSGTVQMVIEQSTSPGGSPNLDVDFIIYGPFTDVVQACQGELTAVNTIDCSYSANSVENVTISNAQEGELYVLLITNFSGQPGYISVTQTAGSGATDCSILSTSNGCEGSAITLDATTEDAVNYIWYEEDPVNSGNYILIPGVNSETYDVSIEKRYKAEAIAQDGSILETYEFNTNFFETPIAPSLVNDYALCDNNGGFDGVAEFDLSTMIDDILNGQDPSVFDVSFHETQFDALNNLNSLNTSFSNTSNPQTIYARIYNSSTPDDLECFDITSFNLIVNQLPNIEGLVVSDLNMVTCEYDGDDIETFNLNPALNEIETWLTNNGQTPSDFEISFHTSQIDADTGINALTNISNHSNESSPGIAENPQTLYIRVADALPMNGLVCTNTEINFQLNVFDAAIATAPSQNYIICDNTLDNGIDTGFGLFNLSSTSLGDGYDYTGLTGLSLHEEILSGLPSHLDPADFLISFYSSQEGANNGVGDPDQINETFENTIPFYQTIFIRVEDSASQGICYDTTEIALEVLPLPVFDLEDDFILCTNVNGTELLEFPTLDTQLNSTQYDFEWYIDNVLESNFNGMSSITATVPGEYSVLVTNIVTGCTNALAATDTYTAVVFESSPPIVTAEVISQPFTESNSIQVTAEGSGIAQYEFSLNNGPWFSETSTSSIFTHIFTEDDTILLGDNIVNVRDINGCGWTEVTLTIMDYPLFFTPNGDGINDTWNIYGMDNQVNAKIYIYDRFGKLLKSISPLGSGWDGTFNGEMMPSSDYWFTVQYNNPDNLDGNLQKYSSHFTLKR